MKEQKEGQGLFGRLFGRKKSTLTSKNSAASELMDWPKELYPKFSVEPNKHTAASTMDTEKIREKARGIIEQLAKMGKEKKFVYLVIDDNPRKFREDMDYFLKPLMEEDENKDWKWIPVLELDGESGIELYRAVCNTDSQESPIPIVIQIDGNLAPPDKPVLYTKGIQVAKKIWEISNQRSWKMPLLVGGSVDFGLNTAIKQVYPDQYIGDSMNYRQVVETLKARISVIF